MVVVPGAPPFNSKLFRENQTARRQTSTEITGKPDFTPLEVSAKAFLGVTFLERFMRGYVESLEKCHYWGDEPSNDGFADYVGSRIDRDYEEMMSKLHAKSFKQPMKELANDNNE